MQKSETNARNRVLALLIGLCMFTFFASAQESTFFFKSLKVYAGKNFRQISIQFHDSGNTNNVTFYNATIVIDESTNKSDFASYRTTMKVYEDAWDGDHNCPGSNYFVRALIDTKEQTLIVRLTSQYDPSYDERVPFKWSDGTSNASSNISQALVSPDLGDNSQPNSSEYSSGKSFPPNTAAILHVKQNLYNTLGEKYREQIEWIDIELMASSLVNYGNGEIGYLHEEALRTALFYQEKGIFTSSSTSSATTSDTSRQEYINLLQQRERNFINQLGGYTTLSAMLNGINADPAIVLAILNQEVKLGETPPKFPALATLVAQAAINNETYLGYILMDLERHARSRQRPNHTFNEDYFRQIYWPKDAQTVAKRALRQLTDYLFVGKSAGWSKSDAMAIMSSFDGGLGFCQVMPSTLRTELASLYRITGGETFNPNSWIHSIRFVACHIENMDSLEAARKYNGGSSRYVAEIETVSTIFRSTMGLSQRTSLW